jgi:aminoglycoside phosphotransferase (APT) family kinase protein
MSTAERAVRAAVAVAANQGVDVRAPVVLRDVTNVVVRLDPAPYVARVPLVLSRTRGLDWWRTEVDVARALARRSAPVTPPALAIDPGPHVRDGLYVSFWELVEHDDSRFDAAEVGRSLRELHGALESCPGPLPRYDRLDEVDSVLAGLEPSDLASAGELERLHSAVSHVRGLLPETPARPLHGDAHFRNLLWTSDGPVWTDLENLCAGPVEYDLACLAWRGWPGTSEALAAYGAHDTTLREAVTPALAVFLATWTLVVVGRVPTDTGRRYARERLELALAYAA